MATSVYERRSTDSRFGTTTAPTRDILSSNDDTPSSVVSYRWKIAMSKPYVDRLVVKSRHRVKRYGEVFTPRSMVDRMLDLVSGDLEGGQAFVDSTFLEPAAGDGNFIVAILQRKLAAIGNYSDASAWQRESLFALASIYAIELLGDNHRDAQAALLGEFVMFHASSGTPCSPRTDLYRAAAFLVETNILRGNTLTGRTPNGDEIEFSWWTRQADDPTMVKREPFTFNSLREDGTFDFRVYTSYEPCPVRHVHKKARSHA
ncbi:methylase [Curtobacterium sp. MCBD17_008]|nr:methylase [Curtobacterium sp. MCBD17_008]